MSTVKNGINSLGDLVVPYGRQFRTLAMAIANNTWTVVPMNTAQELTMVDLDGWSMRTTLPGLYRIDAYALFAVGPASSRQMQVNANGTRVMIHAGSQAAAGMAMGMALSDTVRLGGGAVVTLEVWQNSGANLDLNVASQFYNRLSLTWVGA